MRFEVLFSIEILKILFIYTLLFPPKKEKNLLKFEFFYYTSPCNFFNACNSSMGLYEHGTPVVELRKKLTFIGISAPKCP